jgi:hypothetical protein
VGPATYPQFQRIADIGRTDAKVFYFEGDTDMEYLIAAGVLTRAQVDGSYDGKPANFVAAGGKAAQAGFATSEPDIYENEVHQWASRSATPWSTRPATRSTRRPCRSGPPTPSGSGPA